MGFKMSPLTQTELTLGSPATSIRQKQDTHIVFLITHGFAARMMIRSGVAQKLTLQGACVTVITPNADELYLQQECSRQAWL